MEVEVDLTVDDLLAFHQNDALRRAEEAQEAATSRQVSWWIYGVLVGLAIVAAILAMVSDRLLGPNLPIWGGIIGGVFAVIFVVVVLLWNRASMRMLRRHYSQEMDKGTFGNSLYRISPTELVRLSPTSASTTRWSAIESISVVEDYAYIYDTGISAHIIPKRAFTNDEAFERFVATARKYHTMTKNPLGD